MSGNDKKKSKKTMWIILIILVVVAVYFLNKKNENLMDLDKNRLICDVVNPENNNECFAENLEGTFNRDKSIKVYVLNNTNTRQPREIAGCNFPNPPTECPSSRPDVNQLISDGITDFNNILKQKINSEYNLIVYQTKFQFKTIRIAYIAFIYILSVNKLYKLEDDDRDIYDVYIITENRLQKDKTTKKIVVDNSRKDRYNRYIILSNPNLIEKSYFSNNKGLFQFNIKYKNDTITFNTRDL